MGGKFEELRTALNRAASQLPLVDKGDLTPLAEIVSGLEMIAANERAPQALRSMAARGAKLAEHIILEETDFDSGCGKLGQCLTKMNRSIDGLAEGGNRDDEEPGEPWPTVDDMSSGAAQSSPEQRAERGSDGAGEQGYTTGAEDVQDLVVKFASQQKPVLEDLEAYILELEKGNPNARDAIRRLLHTWKGEFGVLGLQDYCGLVHDVEQAMEEHTYRTEELFRLKDFLADRLDTFASGTVQAITPSERSGLLPGATEPAPREDECSGQEEATPQERVPQAEEVPTSGERAFEGDPSLMGDFITESRDHIQSAEPLLLELETDPANADNLHSIFRSFHTIKGVAGFLGLKEVSSLAHSMENIMDMARKGNLALQCGHIDLMLESVDCLKELIGSIESTMGGGTYTIPDSYPSIMQRLSSPSSVTTAGDSRHPVPSDKKVGEILIESGCTTRERVAEALKKQKEGDPRKVGEILIQEGEAEPRSVGAALASQNAARQKSTVQETVRVPVERLDALVDAIGEAVIAQSMIAADPAVIQARNQALDRKVTQANQIMRQVQELSMSLRMVSVKSTFQKMARLVRDLARKSGKNVEMITDGEDTELDKSVVEHIGDPLIHMVRNAIDHGVEADRQERVSVGKPAKATVVLRAYHKAGSVCIEVEDDGRGLDKEAILAKALRYGLCNETDRLSDQEIYQFIFHPGFSTAKKVTDVSGRGVGMDVVKRNIESLRGSIEIHSQKGKGTKFSTRLPLTLAIIDGMIIRQAQDRYIVPTLSIIESFVPDEGQIETFLDRGEMVKLRGDMLPMTRLVDLFGGNGVGRSDCSDGVAMVVEDMLGKRVALLVDEILGQQQVVIKSLGDGLCETAGLAGGAIMSDGTVSLIIDIGDIVKMATGGTGKRESLRLACEMR